jgi:hypothetical protein
MEVSRVQNGVSRGWRTGRMNAWSSSTGCSVSAATSTAPISMISISSRGTLPPSSHVASTSITT